MIKSPEQIKDQLEFWFLKYFDKTKEEFNGKEKFTLFELIEENTKDKLVTQLGLIIGSFLVIMDTKK
jgi:hypothetical protein